jgi:superkiller protein 3
MFRRRGGGSPEEGEPTAAERRFAAQGMYAESIVRQALGERKASFAALERSLEIDPQYAPAILSVGTLDYQRRKVRRGRKLLLSLVALPADATDAGEDDLVVIIDEAGDFLIQSDRYADGVALYRAAVKRFPDRAVFYQGLGCCAAHEKSYEEALAAYGKARELEPENQEFVNDFGWTLHEMGRLDEARQLLEQAVEMNPEDELARENLRVCNAAIRRARKDP